MFTKSSFGHGPGAHPYHIHYCGARGTATTLPAPRDTIQPLSNTHARTHRLREEEETPPQISLQVSVRTLHHTTSLANGEPALRSLSLSARLSSYRPLHKRVSVRPSSHTRVFSHRIYARYLYTLLLLLSRSKYSRAMRSSIRFLICLGSGLKCLRKQKHKESGFVREGER